MKKIFMFTALLLIAATLLGQAPASFKYQAVLRDSRGNVKANVNTNIKIDILQGSSSGSVVYSENHSVTTNMYGLINLEVGNGLATKGSFSAIDWGTSTYFIKIFVDGVEMGTDQLLSVPYAMNAKTAEKVTGKLTELDPVFLASPAMGITSGNLTNWTAAFGWGNHATAGYLKASSSNDVSNWNTAFGWGNHATAGYLKSYTETDPAFLASPVKGITTNNITDWNKAVAWGDHALAGYLKSSSENDPIFKAWNKSTGIIITASQVSDFQSSVTNNAAVLENSAKNSYPDADKLKLSGIQDSAEVNVNADWNATGGDAKILNKPTIPVGANPGDMQYWNGSAWVMVPVGLPGQFLKLSASNLPEWSAILPTVTTTIASSITDVSSNCGGIVTSDGAGTVSARGVCYSTSPSPTTANSITNNGTGTGAFVSNLTGLSHATTYYVRAYATNSIGTSYGSEVSFKTSPVLPTVTTTAISAITQTTATSGGNITNDGGADISARGVCWSTSASPTTADTKTSDATGTGTFTSNLTGLTGNTTYYVRAYVTNSAGTSYGSEISFKTSPVLPTVTTTAISSITQTTALSGGNITNDGGAEVTARGICWSTSSSPTTADNKTTNGTGTETFTSNLTGLTGNTTYYVRSYAVNSIGTSYGSEVSFKTGPVLPTVTTTAISSITQTTALSGGNITNDGGAGVTARGVCWSTTTNPTTADSKTSDATGTGTFTSSLTGLSGNTTYYVRSYGINSTGTSYGSEVSFKTSPVLPTVTTTAISSITQTTASSGGNVTDDGGASVTARGVCWSTTSNPTTADSKTSDATGTGSYTSSLSGLSGNTTYYVRSYATNSVGTSYGSENTLTTAPSLTDVEGTVYSTVRIGSQVWMASNLKTTKYNNGELIETTIPASLDISSGLPKYQWTYDGDGSYVADYGRLYTWYAVSDSRKVCPSGWHLPTDLDWATMVTYLGGTSQAGGKLKETGINHWLYPNTDATNETGFNALPGGHRYGNGTFAHLREDSNWWSSTEYATYQASFYSLFSNSSDAYRSNTGKESGFYVRCIQD